MVACQMDGAEHGQVTMACDCTVPAAAQALFSACRIRMAAGSLASCLAGLSPAPLACSYPTFWSGGSLHCVSEDCGRSFTAAELEDASWVKMLSLLLIYQEKTTETQL